MLRTFHLGFSFDDLHVSTKFKYFLTPCLLTYEETGGGGSIRVFTHLSFGRPLNHRQVRFFAGSPKKNGCIVWCGLKIEFIAHTGFSRHTIGIGLFQSSKKNSIASSRSFILSGDFTISGCQLAAFVKNVQGGCPMNKSHCGLVPDDKTSRTFPCIWYSLPSSAGKRSHENASCQSLLNSFRTVPELSHPINTRMAS